MNWVSWEWTYTNGLFFNYRCSLFPHNTWVYLNLHHSTRLFTEDLYQCFLPTDAALPGSPRKLPSCSDRLCHCSGPPQRQTWPQTSGLGQHAGSPERAAQQGTLVIHADKAECTEPPCCGCISPLSHLLPQQSCWTPWALRPFPAWPILWLHESSQQPNTTNTNTQTLLILCKGGIICIHCDHLREKALGGFKCKI